MNFIDFIIPILAKLQNFSYLLVFFISFVESLAFVGLFIPGTIFNIFIGFLAGKGLFDIGDLIWFAILGAILGDGLSFYLGKKAKKLFKPENKIFRSAYLLKGNEFFKKHGSRSVFFGRFIGPIRPIIPFVSGLLRMKTKTFLFWDILSAFGWAIFYLLLGYFFGQAWQIVASYSTRAGIFLIIIFIFLVLIYLLKKLILNEGKRLLIFLKSILISIIQAITKNPDVINLVKNHPLFFAWVNKRLDTKQYTGLPLTLSTLAFLYIFALSLGIIRAVVKSSAIVEIDVRLENLLYLFRQPLMIKIFDYITLLGRWQIGLAMAIVASLLFWLWQKKKYIIPFWLNLSGMTFFVVLGKMVFERPRPVDIAYYLEKSYSFPSGHAALAVALYGFFIYYFWRNLKKLKDKINILFLGLIIIIAIGFSRLYLGVHFLSDVLGGYLLGLLWLIIGINVAEWPRVKKEISKKIKITNKLLALSLGSIICAIIFIVTFTYYFQPEVIIEDKPPQFQIISGSPLDIFKNNEQAKYSETLNGTKQEYLSFIIIAPDDATLIKAFQTANWFLADQVNLSSLWKISQTAILNLEYKTAPMTPSFWQSNIHNFGFEKPTSSGTVRQRHHARFWRTNYKTTTGQNIYVGTASEDIGLKWIIVHTIKPDIDTERELLFSDLQKADVIANFSLEQFVEPHLGKNFAGDQFFTDGKIYILEFK